MPTSANTGSQNIAMEAWFFTRYVLLLRQPAGLNLHRAGILPGNLYLLITSAFYLYGLRPALPTGFAAA
ncbi:hypothetical protein EAO91_23460 [Salmonella enterica]|nr:hypothetical protein [Salmonella enterica]EBI6016075.1 hypothetical protein [Salmonella enterica]EBY3008601.1 hypothetical protein [Salmonella enterica subsp. enterica serovar Ekpoui]